MSIIADEIVHVLEDLSEISKLKSEIGTKTAFVASMSHELRTPLTSVLGFTDVLIELIEKEEIDKSKIKKSLSIMQSNSEHLLNLIGDILDFSKLEAKKIAVVNKPFSLHKALKQSFNTLNVLAEKNGVAFKINKSLSAPETINGDLTLFKQVIFNLGSNAIKFASGESVDVHVDLLEGDQKVLCLDFIDTGIGMSRDEASLLFRPFSQANESIAKRFDGTGLGLAISKEIVELFDGSISLIKTEKGKGSHFRVQFPFVEPLKESLVEPTQISEKKEKALFDGKSILIVDDIKENRFLLRHYLKDFDLNFKDASTGEKAINTLNEQIDYVFLDLQLPDMSGIEVFQKIKSELKSHQKVIAFTASSTNSGVEECLKMGFKSYLTKPFNKESIVDSIRSAHE